MLQIELYQKFMEMASFELTNQMKLDDGCTLLVYQDTGQKENFTTCGYDEIFSGAIFDENGKLVMGYMDSHVAYSSANAKIIDRILSGRLKFKLTND